MNIKFKTFLFICCVFFLQAHIVSAAQVTENKYTIKIEKQTLHKALKKIQDLTGFSFAYSFEQIDDQVFVQAEIKDQHLGVLMNGLLENTTYDYEIYDDKIIIRQSINRVIEQQDEKYTVTGKVVDNNNQPIPFCNILVEGTTIGTVTDIDGNYTITYTKKPFTLMYSFIGFITKKVEVTGTQKIDISLEVEGFDVEEVVVTGYQKVDRKLFAGSAAKLSAEDAKVSGVTDVGRMLEGKVAGVSVQSVSGTFGAAPKIRVRGASSIYGDTKPLWVVDGVVLEDVVDVSPDQLSSGDISTLISSSVAGLNSDDIESFQILKDASATALYGARAMNGVIVITTKKGKEGKSTITINSEMTMKQKPRYMEYDILNSQDQMSVFREMERKGWLNHSDMMRSQDGGVYFQMYDAINTYNPGMDSYLLENTPAARAEYLKYYERVNTDWFDLLFKNSIMQNHTVSFSGGSKTSKYYVSGSLLNDDGWTVADKVNRYTINMRGDFDLNDKLSIGIQAKGSYREQKAPGTFSRTADVVNGDYSREFDINPFSYALNTSRTLTPYQKNGSLRYNRMSFADFNILDEFENNYIDLNVLDLSTQIDLGYEFTKHLTYRFVGSLRYVKSTNEHRITENSNVSKAYRANDDTTIEEQNKYLFQDPENPNERPMVVLPTGGFFSREDNMLVNWYYRNIINYNKILKEIHALNVMAGQEMKYADRKYFGFDGYGIQYNKGNTVYTDPNMFKRLAQGGFPNFAINNGYDRYIAFFMNTAYSYKGKYTFNGTMRVDGSNRLGESKQARWLPTWNVSAKWDAKSEPFLTDVEWLSHLQIRGTYGLTASMGPATNSKPIYKNQITIAPFLEEKQNGLTVQSLENSELTWEKQYELNFGFDLGLFNNKISIQSDFYRRNAFDLIAGVKTSGIGGQMYKLANYADMTSKGFEFSLNTKNYKSKNFAWVTNMTFACNENEITDLKSSPYIIGLTKAEGGAKLGGPVRGLYSVPFAGLDERGMPRFYDKDGNITSEVFFQDTNTDHLIYEGPIDPKMIGGLSNRFDYKNFSLNIFCTYQFGNKIRLYPSFHAKYSDLDAMPQDMKNRWLISGDEKKTDIPVIPSRRLYDEFGQSLESTYNAYNYSNTRVADGSFVRLKEVSLSYKLNKSFVDKIGITNASLKLQGTNLLLLYADKKLKGQDPEFFGTGGVALPVPKQYTLTLKLTL